MQDHSALVTEALEVNRACVAELQAIAAALTKREDALRARIHALRHKRALQRAKEALEAIGVGGGNSSTNGSIDSASSGVDIFTREPESRYKKVGVVPQSYIRPKSSFFHDDEWNRHKKLKEAEDEDVNGGQPAKKKPKRQRVTIDIARKIRARGPTEPLPNSDTRLLRNYSHEAFIATPATVFTAKEREIVQKFAHQQLSLLRTNDQGNSFLSSSLSSPSATEIPLTVWNRITSQKPIIRRTGFACKLRWELHDAPHLRLCAWTKEEDKALKALASGEVDPTLVNRWDVIASKMPIPGRPPVHCLIRYQTKFCATNLNTSFTPEEDALIQEAVQVFGERWNIIADLMDGRVAEQIRHRWQQSLAPNLRQGKFSIIEDRRLLLALFVYRERATATPFQKENVAWHEISHHVPGRSQPPIRDRFINSLNPAITFKAWTKDEDEKILALVKKVGLNHPRLWARIAEALGNRSDNQVMRRWRVLAPMQYKQFKESKKNKRRSTLPAIFQRPSIGRKNPRAKATYEKRSSYNAQDDPTEEDDADEENEFEVGINYGSGKEIQLGNQYEEQTEEERLWDVEL